MIGSETQTHLLTRPSNSYLPTNCILDRSALMNLVKKIPSYKLCFNFYFAVACILYLAT